MLLPSSNGSHPPGSFQVRIRSSGFSDASANIEHSYHRLVMLRIGLDRHFAQERTSALYEHVSCSQTARSLMRIVKQMLFAKALRGPSKEQTPHGTALVY